MLFFWAMIAVLRKKFGCLMKKSEICTAIQNGWCKYLEKVSCRENLSKDYLKVSLPQSFVD